MTPDRRNRLITDIEAELMDCLLEYPKIEYPWNTADPDTADYYVETDRNFSLDDFSDEELQNRSQAFFTQIKSNLRK
jgi:hypothetical protein